MAVSPLATAVAVPAVVEKTAGVRRAGSAALDLAYVACGRLDAFWELNLKSWDMAAGVLMVQEAGGVVSELYGGEDPLATGHVLAANTNADLIVPVLETALNRPPSTSYAELSTIIQEEVHAALTGIKPASQAMDDACVRVDAMP